MTTYRIDFKAKNELTGKPQQAVCFITAKNLALAKLEAQRANEAVWIEYQSHSIVNK